MINTIFLLGIISLPDTLTLHQATVLLLKYNPAIRVQKTSSLMNKLTFQKSVVGLFPSPSISGSYTTRARYPGLVSPQEGGTYGVDFWIEQTLFDPQTFRSVFENKYQSRLSELSLKSTRIEALYEMRLAYYDVFKAQEKLNVIRITLQRARETLKFVEKKKQLGESVMLDLLQAKLNYQKALLDSITVAQDFEIKRQNLASIIGMDTLNFIAVEPPSFPPDTGYANYLIENGKSGLGYHPDMQQKLIEKKVSHIGFISTVTSFLPSVKYGYYWNYFGTEFPDVSRFRDMSTRTRGFYVSLVFRFFDYPFDVAISKLSEEVQSENIRSTRIKLYREFNEAVSEYRTAKEMVKISELSLKTAKEAYKLARGQYENGVITIVDLLKSEEDLRNAEINLIDSRLKLLSAVDRLRKAVGEELR